MKGVRHRQFALRIAGALIALMWSAGLVRADNAGAVKARYLQLADNVNKVARSLETSLNKDDVKVAERLYKLEFESGKLVGRAAEVKYADDANRVDQLAQLRSLHQDILTLQERLLQHTLDELDKALPGEPNRELWAREGIDLYRPLFRSTTPDGNKRGRRLSKDERGQGLARMQEAFASEGGDLGDIHYLGQRTLKGIESGELVEWTQLGERIRITAAGAKHPVIANGASVRGAGSMKIYRDSKGEVQLAVVSNSSGNYKPGIGSAFGLAAKLEDLGVPPQRILITEVMPGEPVLVKLLLKSKKMSKGDIESRIKTLRDSVEGRGRMSRLSPRRGPRTSRLRSSMARSKEREAGARSTRPARMERVRAQARRVRVPARVR